MLDIVQLLGKEYTEEFIKELKEERFIGSKLAKDERGLIGF